MATYKTTSSTYVFTLLQNGHLLKSLIATGSNILVSGTVVSMQYETSGKLLTDNFLKVNNTRPYLQVSSLTPVVISPPIAPPIRFRGDSGNGGVASKLFENIGGIAGVGYGLYFAHTHKPVWWAYIFWAVIFGLAFHEIGEQADRIMIKART